MTRRHRGVAGGSILLLVVAMASCGGGATADDVAGPQVDVPGGDAVVADVADAAAEAVAAELVQTETTEPVGWIDNGDGTVSDRGNGRVWQKKATIGYVDQQSASNACKNSTLAGRSGWRLPTIDELRTLIVGCPATMPEGSCDVVQGCTTCWNKTCNGCTDWTGPGTDRCFIDPIFEGNCSFYWTSSTVTDQPLYTWGVAFYNGKVAGHDKVEGNPFRCVR